jgi:hypothetical protein
MSKNIIIQDVGCSANKKGTTKEVKRKRKVSC